MPHSIPVHKRVCLSVLLLVISISYLTCVEGQMIDRSPSRVQTTLTLDWPVIGSIPQRSVEQITADQRWTLGCETLDRDFVRWETYRDYLAPLGIKKIRFQSGWAKTEKQRGQYDFTWLDKLVNEAHQRGLTPWLELDYGNPIYEGGGGHDLAGRFPTSPESLAAWDRWVEAMVTRYKDKVCSWSIWNEPDIVGADKTAPKKTPEQIADFNIRTAEIIRRIDPNAKIGALSLAYPRPEFVDACMKRFAQRAKLGLFDWIIYHGYSYNPDEVYTQVEECRATIAKYDKRIKLWQGENGCPSEETQRFALPKHNWTELTQAKWDIRRMLGDLGHDVDRCAVFTVCDFYHTGRSIGDEINRKGLLKINDREHLAKVKIAWYAVQNVVSVFDERLARQKNYSYTVDSTVPVTLYAYRDAKAKLDLLVFWNGAAIPSDDNETQQITLTVKNGLFTDPVWADLITGRIHEIPDSCKTIEKDKIVLRQIPVYDAPAIIVDRARLITPLAK